MKLHGVMLGSENTEALGAFYEKVFGSAGWKEGGWYGFNIGGSYLMIGPHSEVKGKNQDSPRIMMAFECEDIKADFERVKSCGAKVIAEPYQPDATNSSEMWLATLADPEDNYIQLSSPWEE